MEKFLHKCIMTALLLLAAPIPPAYPWTCWQAATGAWEDSANWSEGVPTLEIAACIDNGGTAEITENSFAQSAILVLGEYAGEEINTVEHMAGTNTIDFCLFLGMDPGSSGVYNLGNGGELLADYELVGCGGTGIFNHTGGTNNIEKSLQMALEEGASGTYNLSGSGELFSGNELIGFQGVATFNQSGGTHTVQKYFILGHSVGASGTYNLSGTGELFASEERIGNATVGKFIQSGGKNTVSNELRLGYCNMPTWGDNYLGDGTYNLSGTGELVARYERIGWNGIGTFIQTGGTNTVSEICIGHIWDSTGTYELSGTGVLSAGNEYVGNYGKGTFVHTGGTNNIYNRLYLGGNSGSLGTYKLSDTGIVSAAHQLIGWNGSGAFVQTGGTNNASQEILIGGIASGTYTISGGSINVAYLGIGCGFGGGPDSLNIADPAAEITISKKLSFGSNSNFTAAPGSVIYMVGAQLENKNWNPSKLSGLSNVEFIFEREAGDIEFDSLEVSGKDLGVTVSGFDNNFALGTLSIGGGDIGRVRLVDLFNNQAGTEALYVYNLNINAGSCLDLNGLNLYYVNGAIDPGAIIVLNGGKLQQVFRLETAIDINPDTLNLSSNGQWITCYIVPPEEYDVFDIDPDTIFLNKVVKAEWSSEEDGMLMVKFDRSAIIVAQILEPGDEVELTVTGELIDGNVFEGTDSIRIIAKGRKK